MTKLSVSRDGHSFADEHGADFLWLADTAWTILNHLDEEEVEFYLSRRRDQGFTVIQLAILDPEGHPRLQNGTVSALFEK